ncbi:dUTP diphosphatase [Sphaerotilus montanus]|uniref:dUTP diphosphatase n=1 Tax=Sphaerotilus montanus TaxID=522889 RepID=A0A7Y9QZL2_9BURK|nr:dUTP diphosphatase [Sphaerotilus montanus]NYG34446.1 dUTP pyrophosphatase [Sphaerotilus montanus]NZD55701.1 dUTP diphosphatase [Sphaerotilus montanus]
MVGPDVEVKVLDARLQDWGLPRYQSEQAAGIDLIACLDAPLEIHPQAPAQLVPTGLALHMNSAGFCAVIVPRSGLGHKKGLVLGNSIGVIDADYMAQCYVSVWNRNPSGEPIVIQPGDRIAQMLFVPILRPRLVVVEEFAASSERGLGGFGSTGVTSASTPA